MTDIKSVMPRVYILAITIFFLIVTHLLYWIDRSRSLSAAHSPSRK